MVRLRYPGAWLTGFALLVTFHCSPANATASSPRQKFARALVRVAQSLRESPDPERAPSGMHKNQVLRLLGPPDEIRPTSRYNFYADTGNKADISPVIWCYGVEAPGEFPTLGRVVLDSNERVATVYGNFGAPCPPGVLPEKELRRLLSLLDRLPGSWDALGGQADPLVTIQAVNALQRLGKDRALAVVDEFFRLSLFQLRPREAGSDVPYGLYPFLHTLFSIPADPESFILRDNVTLQGDIPLSFSMIRGGAPGVGVTQEDLDNFKKYGTIRPRPLRPLDRPWSILTQLVTSHLPREEIASQADLRQVVAGQLLLLLRSVYRSPTDKDGILVPHGKDFPDWWERVVRDLNKLDIRWDSRRDTYVFADGTQLAPETPRPYRSPIR